MNYILKPSLEHMALVKIVTALWNQDDVRALLTKYTCPLSCTEAWHKIEEKVVDKLQKLSLPELLKEKALNFIKPIGLEIFAWMKLHCTCSYLLAKLPPKLSWTPQGSVDRKKTAEVLIKNENLHISQCYKLACIYCLKNEITELWSKMPEHHRKSFLYQGIQTSRLIFSEANQQDLVFFWTSEINQKECVNVDFSYKSIFESCAFGNNKVASEYLLPKLTPKEREESLVNIVKREIANDALCFLLSQLKEEQQMEVFKINSYIVLQSYLRWPFQRYFIDIANRVWDILSKKDYFFLLISISHKISNGYKDWDYKRLFKDCWKKSPYALGNFNIDEFDNSDHVLILNMIKDKGITRFILKDATLSEKKKLMYCKKMQWFCRRLIMDQEWDFLEFFLRECLPSGDEMIKFKDEFEKCIMWQSVKCYLSRNTNKWNELFSLPDDSVCKDKRSAENEECSSSKRLCGLQ